jgi:hypothetical protein
MVFRLFSFNGVHDYHQKTDTPEKKIEFDVSSQKSAIGFTIVRELANRDNRPVVDK